MSDTAPTTPPPATEAPQGAPAEPAPDTEPAGAPSPPPWEGQSPEELYKLTEKLKSENTGYKERFRPYEQAFGSLHHDDQQFLLGFFNSLAAGDEKAIAQYAPQMRQVLDQLSPAQQQQVVDAAQQAAGGTPDFDPYDKTNIDKLVTERIEERLRTEQIEREREKATQDNLRMMEDHAKTLADKHELADFGIPGSTINRALYLSAYNDFPDEPNLTAKLDRAAEKIQMDLAQQAQALLKRKSADAGPSPVPAGAREPSGEKKPTSMADAKGAARERLNRILDGAVGT